MDIGKLTIWIHQNLHGNDRTTKQNWPFTGSQMVKMAFSWYSPISSSNYSGVIMGAMASQITGISFVCSVVCAGADQRIHPHHWPLWAESTWWRYHELYSYTFWFTNNALVVVVGFLLTTWVQTNAVHKTLLSWKQLYIDSDNNDTKIQYTSKYTSYVLLII